MDIQAEHVLRTALALNPNDRAEIAATLIQSLDDEADEDVELAWAQEIKRRVEALDTGQAQLVPWDEVRRAMR